MSGDNAIFALAAIVGPVVGSIGALILLSIAALSLGRDIWQLIFIDDTRRTSMRWIGLAFFIIIFGASGATLGLRPGAMLFATFAIAPWLTVRGVNLMAWWTDDEDTRTDALTFRNREKARLGEPPIEPD